MCKILEPLGQHPQKNDLSKSATFDPIFQLLHSAMEAMAAIIIIIIIYWQKCLKSQKVAAVDLYDNSKLSLSEFLSELIIIRLYENSGAIFWVIFG